MIYTYTHGYQCGRTLDLNKGISRSESCPFVSLPSQKASIKTTLEVMAGIMSFTLVMVMITVRVPFLNNENQFPISVSESNTRTKFVYTIGRTSQI